MNRHDPPDLQAASSFLLMSQNADGGWGYAPGQSSVVEPTAAAALALRSNSNALESWQQRALGWIQAAQHRDGGWGINSEDAESGWQTAWAVLALAHAGVAHNAVDRGAAWLRAAEPHDLGDDETQRRMQEVLAIDIGLQGWSWRPGESSFVEPTALAMLALHAVPVTGQIRARLDEAVAYLRDRRCHSGGWNMGNPVMFGNALPACAHPTAWVLLALTRIAPQALVDEDRVALLADMECDGGALALAWGVFALKVLGHEDDLMATRLARLQAPNGGWNENPYHTAAAIMAIRGSF